MWTFSALAIIWFTENWMPQFWQLAILPWYKWHNHLCRISRSCWSDTGSAENRISSPLRLLWQFLWEKTGTSARIPLVAKSENKFALHALVNSLLLWSLACLKDSWFSAMFCSLGLHCSKSRNIFQFFKKRRKWPWRDLRPCSSVARQKANTSAKSPTPLLFCLSMSQLNKCLITKSNDVLVLFCTKHWVI